MMDRQVQSALNQFTNENSKYMNGIFTIDSNNDPLDKSTMDLPSLKKSNIIGG